MQHSARALMISAAAAAILASVLIWAIAAQGARGDTPTPTISPAPTASPTPSATATPYPQSTITIRFVRDGQATSITLSQPFREIRADDVICNIGVTPAVVVVDSFSIDWPLRSFGLAPECEKGPPTTVRIEFRPYWVAEDVLLDPIAAEVMWEGQDIVTDLEIPADVLDPDESPHPTDSASTSGPSSTPGILPKSGAVDTAEGIHVALMAAGSMALAAAGISLCATGRRQG